MKPKGSNERLSKPFDPAQPYHRSPWSPDISGVALPNRGFTVWLSAYRVPDAKIKIFVKPGGQTKLEKPSTFSAIAVGKFKDKRVLPMTEVTLTPQRPWDLLGTMVVDNDYNLIFAAATQEERDEEWRVRKLQPLPLATPTAIPSATMTREQREDLIKRSEAIRKHVEEEKKQHGTMPLDTSPAPSASTPNDSPNDSHHGHGRAPSPQPSATP